MSAELASNPVRAGPLATGRPGLTAESMRDVFDIYTIIFLALAVFIFLRLRSVLGQRTGRERPPYDPYSARDAVRTPTGDKVVTLPTRTAQPAAAPAEPTAPPAADRWNGIAEAGSPTATALDAITAQDRAFDLKHFLTGARAAYEMIVTAFAEGDRRTLKNLLSREVHEGFETAIREREGRGETAETRFVSIDKSDVTAAELRGRVAQITVRFVSQLVSVTRDRSGTAIDGSPDKVSDVTDVWTFARDMSSRDPNWKLVATEAGQ
jgi:predicted lipid-binding transport protein (Tim44 family)